MIKELSDFGKPVCEQKYGEWNHVALKEEPISIEKRERLWEIAKNELFSERVEA